MTSSAARPNCPRYARAPAQGARAARGRGGSRWRRARPRRTSRAPRSAPARARRPAAQRALVLIVAGRPGSPLEAHAAALVAAHVRPSGVGLHVVRRAPAPALDLARARVAAARSLVEQWSAQRRAVDRGRPGQRARPLSLPARRRARVPTRGGSLRLPGGRPRPSRRSRTSRARRRTEVLEGPITGAGMASVEVGGAAQAAPPPPLPAPLAGAARAPADAVPAGRARAARGPPARPPAQAPPPTRGGAGRAPRAAALDARAR